MLQLVSLIMPDVGLQGMKVPLHLQYFVVDSEILSRTGVGQLEEKASDLCFLFWSP